MDRQTEERQTEMKEQQKKDRVTGRKKESKKAICMEIDQGNNLNIK